MLEKDNWLQIRKAEKIMNLLVPVLCRSFSICRFTANQPSTLTLRSDYSEHSKVWTVPFSLFLIGFDFLILNSELYTCFSNFYFCTTPPAMLADLYYRFQKTKFLNLLVPVLCRSFLICRVTANQALLPFVVTEVSTLKFKQSFQPGLHDVLKLFILSQKRTAKRFLKTIFFTTSCK